MAALVIRLVFLDGNAVGIRPSILPDAGYLPGNSITTNSTSDLEGIAPNFLGYVQAWGRRSDGSQLIAKILVQSFEPIRQGYKRFSTLIQCRYAVVDVHHVGRFDEGVGKVLVCRIERIVDLERAAALGQSAGDIEIAIDLGRAESTVAIDLESAEEQAVAAAIDRKRVWSTSSL